MSGYWYSGVPRTDLCAGRRKEQYSIIIVFGTVISTPKYQERRCIGREYLCQQRSVAYSKPTKKCKGTLTSNIIHNTHLIPHRPRGPQLYTLIHMTHTLAPPRVISKVLDAGPVYTAHVISRNLLQQHPYLEMADRSPASLKPVQDLIHTQTLPRWRYGRESDGEELRTYVDVLRPFEMVHHQRRIIATEVVTIEIGFFAVMAKFPAWLGDADEGWVAVD